jgi:hypothetical protein
MRVLNPIRPLIAMEHDENWGGKKRRSREELNPEGGRRLRWI